MATSKVILKAGLTIGEVTHLEAEIREASVADMLDASEEAERVILTPDGYQLIASPIRVGIHTLRRQVVRIGSYAGPLTINEIRWLSAGDLQILQQAADQLDQAAMGAVAKRGRDNGDTEES